MGLHWGDAARMLGSPEARWALVRWARQFEDAALLAAIDDMQEPGRSLDQGVIRVIAALYDLPRGEQRGACRAWYRGRQLHPDVLHGLCAEALASADLLANTIGEANDVTGSEPLHAAVSLVLGDLDVLARSCGRRRRLGRIGEEFASGAARIAAGTTDLVPPAEEWERVLWRIQLLSCLTGPEAAVAMRADAVRAARRRPDLRSLTADGSGPAEHLLATIRQRRTLTRGALFRRAAAGVVRRTLNRITAPATRRALPFPTDRSQFPPPSAGAP
jgi:hypothetical protein